MDVDNHAGNWVLTLISAIAPYVISSLDQLSQHLEPTWAVVASS